MINVISSFIAFISLLLKDLVVVYLFKCIKGSLCILVYGYASLYILVFLYIASSSLNFFSLYFFLFFLFSHSFALFISLSQIKSPLSFNLPSLREAAKNILLVALTLPPPLGLIAVRFFFPS